jgi:hypothetical protein
MCADQLSLSLYDVIHRSASMPLGFSGIVCIEAGNNFQERPEAL